MRRRLLPILDWWFGVAIIVGGTIGVGILRTPGTVASLIRDRALITIIWALGGVYAMLCANYTAELATMLPQAGGPLVYARRAFGEVAGAVVGLCDWMLNTASVAFLAIAFMEFGSQLVVRHSVASALGAAAVIVVFAVLDAIGVRASDRVQRVTSGAKGLAVILFAAACFLHGGTGMDVAIATPTPSPISSPPMMLPVTAVEAILAFQIVLAAYGGWNSATYFSEEIESPGRELPKSLFSGAAAVCALYVIVNIALWRLLPLPAAGSSTVAMEDAMRSMFGSHATRLVPLLALVTLPSVINAGQLCGSRVLLALGRQGAMPGPTASVAASGTPVVALAATALCSIALAMTGTFDALLRFYALLAVIMNICLVSALFLLRRREPGAARAFKAWGYPAAPAALLAVDVALCALFIASDRRSAIGALACVVVSTVGCVVARRLFRSKGTGDAQLRTAA